MSKDQCQVCFEGTIHRKEKDVIYTFKGYSITMKQPGDWCSSCNEGILKGDDIAATSQQIENFKKSVKQKNANRILELRKKLKMTQKAASQICGGGINAFHKYEKGEIDPPMATINLLTILANHPHLIKEISHPLSGLPQKWSSASTNSGA